MNLSCCLVEGTILVSVQSDELVSWTPHTYHTPIPLPSADCTRRTPLHIGRGGLCSEATRLHLVCGILRVSIEQQDGVNGLAQILLSLVIMVISATTSQLSLYIYIVLL